MKTVVRICAINLLLLPLIFAVGCGGGTSGTGLSNYEGSLKDVSGNPIADAKVTLLESGDTTVTDTNGAFLLQTEPLAEPPTLFIETPAGTDSTVPLHSAAEANDRLHVDIELNPTTKETNTIEFKIKAAVAGFCDASFENHNGLIRQAVQLPQGQQCTLKVHVEGEGLLRGHIPVAIQVKSCTPDALWITIAEGETAQGLHQGIAQVNFAFFSSKEFCEYRVIAPYNYKDYQPIIYPFQTFAQERFGVVSASKPKTK